MKKLLTKLRKQQPTEEDGRITTETIAEHRERILAGGRRFKYPVQYVRHRLVFNAIIIGVATVVLLVLVGWWQLYLAQNTSDFMYRVTRVVPVPVAVVDGQQVRYSDYLMKYRSAMHYLETKEQVSLKTEDGKRQSDFVKQQAMDDAIADAYAAKLAKERNVTVTDTELEAFLKAQRKSRDGEVSEATYEAVVMDYYGWSPDEYRLAMKQKLLRQKVTFAIDDKATATVATVDGLVKGGNSDLKNIAEVTNQSAATAVEFGTFGWVPKDNQDGGLAVAAAALQKGQVSEMVQSANGDGYYFVKLVDINEAQVNYEYVHVPLTVFADQIGNLQADPTKITVYIALPEEDEVQQ